MAADGPISNPSDQAVVRLQEDVTVALAKAIIAAPGIFMIGASIVMFLTSFLGLYVTFGREEDIEVTVMKWVQLRVNDRWALDLERRIQERHDADKVVEHTIRGIYIVLGFLANGVVLIAGIRMQSLKNYSMCVAGSIVAIILNGCSCVGFPIGIWALLALLRTDVKAGFEVMERRSIAT